MTTPDRYTLEGFAVPVLCPGCAKPLTDDAIEVNPETTGGIEGNYGATAEVVIICTECGELIFRRRPYR